jgi:SAM-dependent methyltransferase
MDKQSFAPENGVRKYNGGRSSLSGWLGTPAGAHLLAWEQAQFDGATEDVFGFRAAQVGLPEIDFLRANRIPYRFSIALEHGGAVAADALQLPLAPQSIDLLALPHVLEFHTDPHTVLREAERVLRPEGQLVLSGFNTLSLWRLRQLFADRHVAPWNAHFIGLLRLRDWLRLLGFDLNGGMFGCYAPPFQRVDWMRRFDFMEKAGARWWPIAGGVYVIRAIKRVHGMILVAPAWRQERARRRALAAIPQKNGHVTQSNGHASRERRPG